MKYNRPSKEERAKATKEEKAEAIKLGKEILKEKIHSPRGAGEIQFLDNLADGISKILSDFEINSVDLREALNSYLREEIEIYHDARDSYSQGYQLGQKRGLIHAIRNEFDNFENTVISAIEDMSVVRDLNQKYIDAEKQKKEAQ